MMNFLIRKKPNIIPLEKRVMLDASLPALAGQVLWLDANDTATVLDAEGDNAASGAAFSGSVATWVDKSSSGFNVTASVASDRPAYTTGALNSKNVLTFDGTADKLINSTASIVGDDFTTFIVFNRTTAAGRDAVLEMGAGGVRNGFFINDVGSGAISYYLSGAFYNFSGPYVVGNYSMLTTIQNITDISLYQNAALNLSATGIARTTSTGIYVGDDSTSGDQLAGNIAEIIIYDRDLTSDERHDVENYLASKWALSITNASPIVSTNTGNTLNEGTTTTVLNTMLSSSDTDNTDSSLIYTITNAVDNGTLMNTNTGLSLGLSATFTQSDIDNGYITYTHNGTETSSDAFDFTVSDQLATTTATFSFTITPVNEAPVINGWTLVSSENFESGATGWSNNTTSSGGAAFTNHLGGFSLDGGVQTVYKTYGLSGTQSSVNISFDMYEIDSWDGETFSIFVNDIAVFTTALNQATFNSPADGSSGAVSWTIQETSSFNGNIGYGAGWVDQKSHYVLTISTTAASVKLGFSSTLNQPTNDESWGIDNVKVYEVASGGTPGAFDIVENSSNGTGVTTIAALDPDGDTLTYSITGGTGVGVFAINGATGAITVSNSSLLNYESVTSYTLDVLVRDPGGLTDSATITINVLDVLENTAPVISALGPLSVAENITAGSVIGTVVATDAESHAITYSITAGNAEGIFAINSTTGALTILSTANLNFEKTASYALTVRATDNGLGNLNSSRTININISNVNEAPSFNNVQRVLYSDPLVLYNATTGNFYKYVSTSLNYAAATAAANATLLNGVGGYIATSTSAVENAFLSSLISNPIWLGGSDLAVEGQWRWAGGADAGQMFWLGAVAGSAQNGYYTNWFGGEPNDFGGVEDGAQMYVGGLWNDAGVATTLGYIVEWTGASVTASLQNGPYSLVENSAINTVVGSVAARDPDAADILSYSITGGTGASYFAVNSATGQITLTNAAAANYELATSYTLNMRVQDIAGLFDTVTVTINITDANDAPTAIALSGNTVMENSSIGTLIGALLSTDEDVADTHTYSLVSNPGNKFTIVGNEIRVAGSIDYEQTQNITLVVRTNDGNGGTFDQSFVIYIGNEGDSFASPPNTGTPKSPDSRHNDGNITKPLGEFQDSLVRSSLFKGEEGQLSAFYGLGQFIQILREGTTFNVRHGFEILKSRLSGGATDENGLHNEIMVAHDVLPDREEAAHYTRLKQALDFLSQMEKPDGIDIKNEKTPDDPQKTNNQEGFNPLNQQFVDIMTYHEQRQAHLRKALLEA